MKKIIGVVLTVVLFLSVLSAAAYADGGTPDHEHEYTPAVTEPTCTEGGYTTYTCEECGDTYKGDETAPLGHDWGEGTVVKEATEKSKGERKFVCSRCGEEKAEEIPRATRELVDSTASFRDVVKTDWFVSSVDYVLTYGLMVGTSATRFEPESGMTRAMIVTVLWRYEGSPVGFANNFKDVPADQWYADAVSWAGENGIVAGTGGGRYEPDGLVTREQLATIMYRYTGYIGSSAEPSGNFADFYDASKVSDWAIDSLKWAVAEGIVRGSIDNRGREVLAPEQNATRAQFATILMRYCSRDEYVHAWGEGERVAEPTCTEKGRTRYVCVDCGAVKNEAISALGHIRTNVRTVTEPTCTAKGESSYYCTRCEKTLTEPIAALGHSWRAATCTAPKTCGRCGLTSGSALGHTLTAFCTRCDHNNRADAVGYLRSYAPKDGDAIDIGYFESEEGNVLVQLFMSNGNPAVLTLTDGVGVVLELADKSSYSYAVYALDNGEAVLVIGGSYTPGSGPSFRANSYSTDELHALSAFVSYTTQVAMYCLDTEVRAHTSDYLGLGGIYN